MGKSRKVLRFSRLVLALTNMSSTLYYVLKECVVNKNLRLGGQAHALSG